MRQQINSADEFRAGRKLVRHVVNRVRENIVGSAREFKQADLHKDVFDRVDIEREQQNPADRFDDSVDAL